MRLSGTAAAGSSAAEYAGGGGGVFFFQAEGSIRDAQESRGLGDVYKRQDVAQALLMAHKQWGSTGAVNYITEARALIDSIYAVSYTHLTLPTTYPV